MWGGLRSAWQRAHQLLQRLSAPPIRHRTGTLIWRSKLRTRIGNTGWLLERSKRAERALTVVATCCLLGVSTRRMDRLRTIGIRVVKSQVSVMAGTRRRGRGRSDRATGCRPYTFVADALVTQGQRRRARGQRARLIATGINAGSYRETSVWT